MHSSPSAPDSSPPSSPSRAPGTFDPRTLPALYRISSLIGRTEDPRLALRNILSEIIAALHASSGSISLLNPDSGKLEIEVHQGLPAESDEVALRLGQGITGWVAFHGRAQLVPDVSVDSRYISMRPEIRAEMAVPMEENGQILGVINVDSDVTGGFTDPDLQLLTLCTQEATAVMTRLWQLRQLRGKARQLETLITIGHSLVSKIEQQELFDTVTRDARQVTQCRACALYLYDDTHQIVLLASLSSNNPAAPSTRESPIETSLAAAAIHTRKQIDFANIQSPEFFDLVDLPRDDSLRSVLATPMIYENEVLGVLAVFTDHVHRFNNDEKRLLAALASLGAVALQNSRLYSRVFQSEESLRKNEQLTTLGLLAAEIAHEIRNPLTVIKLLYGYLGLDFPEDDPRRTDVRVIGEKLDQLEAIVTRVLHFAKAPSSLHSRWPITDIIEDTIVLIRLKLAQSKIYLRFEPPARALVVDVHKGQIQQVLLNLLINSTQAMPDGGGITITCQTEENGPARYVHIDLTDTGPGIPEELGTRIFDSFLSGRPDGTGLGLAIAKRILLSHHGDITLEASSPQGTTMRITLPLA
ncbi:histidine kinase [Nibricoccus aquaticus]|uniref:histidine kinase n=1 Tax=Nibricoccus aquaticus TaxID=2576891 RepID=A0A290QGF6_9BACT|nr:GAF domain-containing sensor histidine kinase [Nibricoccus aquaticus]ATC65346.1 histidine kinase [Nibricoccus aquaticus]